MTDTSTVEKKTPFNGFKPKRNKVPKKKNYKRPSGWKSALLLTLSVCMLVAGVALRVMSGFDDESELEQLTQAQIAKEEKNKKPSYLEVQSIESVGNLASQVKPVTFDDVLLEQRNQDTAFQDVEYIAERKNAWTVQVMDVSKLEIIKDYLATQEKRDQFAYFRYIAEDKSRRYILTFDDFNDKEGAQKVIDNMQFDLPVSIQPFPRAFKEYVTVIEQYHLENKVKEYRKSHYREIKLKKTRAPIYYASNDGRSSTAKSYARNRPTHEDYARRAMQNNNAFKKQMPRTGRVIASAPNPSNELKGAENFQTDNAPSDTQIVNEHDGQSLKTVNDKLDKVAVPQSPGNTKPAKKDQANNDNIANLIEEINN